MASVRLVTWTAIGAGACLGALAALWHEPAPRAAAASMAPFRPVNQIQRSEANDLHARAAPATAAQSAGTVRASTSASVVRPLREQPLPATRAELQALLSSCARGEDDDCWRAGETFRIGSAVPHDDKRALDFRAVAIRRYALRCERRDPDACHALAMLHASGIGLVEDPTAARVLLERAKSACRTRPVAICERL